MAAEDKEKHDSAAESAEVLVNAIKKDLLPRAIMTRKSFENAISLVMAVGGSTNAVLHLLAIAHAAEVPLTLDDFETIRQRVPVLCDLKPSGRYVITDLHKVGGIPQVLKMLLDHGLLHGMQRAVWRLEPFDRHDLAAANRMRQDRARVVRHIIDEDRAGATLGSIAPQLGPAQTQLVAQGPGERFLLHHVHAPRLAVDIQRDQALDRPRQRRRLTQERAAEQIARRRDTGAGRDHAFDEIPPRDRPVILGGFDGFLICHGTITSPSRRRCEGMTASGP
jgi:hypothetical protein